MRERRLRAPHRRRTPTSCRASSGHGASYINRHTIDLRARRANASNVSVKRARLARSIQPCAPLDCMLHRSRRGWGIEAGGHQKCGRRGAPWPPAARLRLGKLRARGGRAWRRRVTFRARAMGGPDAQCEQGFPAVTGKCSGQASFTSLDSGVYGIPSAEATPLVAALRCARAAAVPQEPSRVYICNA